MGKTENSFLSKVRIAIVQEEPLRLRPALPGLMKVVVPLLLTS